MGRRAGAGPSDRHAGSASIEMIGASLFLVMCVLFLLALLGVMHREFVLTALARDAARAASLQPDATSADAAAREALGGLADLRMRLQSADGFVTVELEQDIQILQLPRRIHTDASATALQESPW